MRNYTKVQVCGKIPAVVYTPSNISFFDKFAAMLRRRSRISGGYSSFGRFVMGYNGSSCAEIFLNL